jgi:hypothetical protein
MCRCLFAALVAALLIAAPASASTTFFSSPSKTIGCVYTNLDGARGVRCDLARVDDPKPRPESCNLEYGDAFAVGARGRATRVCHGDTAHNPKAPVLAYGRKKRVGPFTCRVRRTTGMRCTSKRGHGFEVSRERQRLW